MSYSDILTKDEYENTAINSEILHYLEYAREQLKLEKSQMNVLDWGCGCGNYVLFLREVGYNAFGVDVSPDNIERGSGLIREFGYEPEHLLGLLDSTGKTLYPDGFFHFLFSYEVLEHVENIDLVTAETSRLTKSGGFGFHIYPGTWRPIEAHLFMPFIHWLPKNALRKSVIRTYVMLGIEPHWEELEGLDNAVKTDRYFDFSKNKTYYRSYANIVRSFVASSCSARSVVMDHPLLARLRWIPGGFVEQLVLAFKTVEILTQKQ